MSYDEVEIEDMTWNEELQVFQYACPCGDLFQISKVGPTRDASSEGRLGSKHTVEEPLMGSMNVCFVYISTSILTCRRNLQLGRR